MTTQMLFKIKPHCMMKIHVDSCTSQMDYSSATVLELKKEPRNRIQVMKHYLLSSGPVCPKKSCSGDE